MKVNKKNKGIIFISLSVMMIMAMIQNVNAQKGFNLSVKATPEFSFLLNKDDNDNSLYDSKATFNTNFGIGAGYNFTGNIGVAIDGLYSLQGQKYKLSGNDYNQKVNYIKVPVYFTYNTNPQKSISFSGKIGPQVSFLSTSKLTNDDGKDVVSNTDDRFEKTTFGGAAEAGIRIKLQKTLYLTAGVRFDVDFTNAEDKDYSLYPAGRAKTYNMTSGLEVGLTYFL
ncbi:MAG: porin family protein [Ginsengibacter sp.]